MIKPVSGEHYISHIRVSHFKKRSYSYWHFFVKSARKQLACKYFKKLEDAIEYKRKWFSDPENQSLIKEHNLNPDRIREFNWRSKKS